VNPATAPSNNASYSEVGYLYLAAGAFRDDSFTAVDLIQPAGCTAASTCDCISDVTNDNNLSDVLVGTTGRYGCAIGNKTAVTFGRFIPDSFHTAITATSVLPCPTGLVCPCPPQAICPSALTYFVYSGMVFTTNVFASNVSGQTTLNYEGVFAHDVTLSAVDAAIGGVTSPVGSITAGSAVTAKLFVGGTTLAVAVTTGQKKAEPNPVYTFTNTPTIPTDIYLRAIESTGNDGVTSADSTWEQGIKVASGRIKVSNAYGSELLPLTLMATAQYYSANGWVNSLTDSVTNLTLAATYDVVNKGSKTGTTTPAPTGVVTMTNGQRSIVLDKPTGGAVGMATINPTAPTYLPVTPGTATFGVYKGNNGYIYRREN
jgi:MSHA biogenesis protein MshQ